MARGNTQLAGGSRFTAAVKTFMVGVQSGHDVLLSWADFFSSVKTDIEAAAMTLAGVITFSGNNTHSGTVLLSGATTATSTVDLQGVNTFSGATTATSTVDLQGVNTLSGATTATSTIDLQGVNTFSGLTTTTGNVLNPEAGAGIDGIAAAYATSVERVGGLMKTQIFIDLTGLDGSATDDDIIGDLGTGEAHIGRITTAVNGVIYKGQMTCIEIPAGGNPAVALWAATESTGVEDTLIGSITSTEILTSKGASADWVTGDVIQIPPGTLPAADKYLYLVNGDGSGPDAEFSAGIFLIELWGV